MPDPPRFGKSTHHETLIPESLSQEKRERTSEKHNKWHLLLPSAWHCVSQKEEEETTKGGGEEIKPQSNKGDGSHKPPPVLPPVLRRRPLPPPGQAATIRHALRLQLLGTPNLGGDSDLKTGQQLTNGTKHKLALRPA